MAKREPPVSIRLNFQEKADLRQAAESYEMSVSAYVKWRALSPDAPPPSRSQNRQPSEYLKTVAQILGQLGKTRAYNNLNQITKAINFGHHVASPDTEDDLQEVCQLLSDVGRAAMQVLGRAPKP